MPRKPTNGIAPMTSTERSKAARDRMHAELERLRAENARLSEQNELLIADKINLMATLRDVRAGITP